MTVPPYIGYPLAAVAVYGALYIFANGQIFHPMKYPDGWWEVQDELGAQDVAITAADGIRLHGWWSPADGAGLATLYLHGNAGNVSHRGSHIRAVNEAGTSILVIDYRGYGTTPGRPTTGNTCRDADTAFQYLVNDLGVPANRIIIHGHSVGGGPALTVAKKYDPAGVIIESSFTSAFRVLSRWPIFPFDKFINSSRIARINCPLLVIHGADDHIIPPWHGQALYDKARDPKTFCLLPDASHNDIPFDVEEIMMGSITNFAATLPQ